MAIEPHVMRKAREFGDRIAVEAEDGTWSYRALLLASARMADALLGGRRDLEEERVALLVAPGGAFVSALWATWRAGGIAVPLAISHPEAELEHVLRDSGARILLVDAAHRGRVEGLARSLGIALLAADPQAGEPEFGLPGAAGTTTTPSGEEPSLPPPPPGRRALMIYTSGTTGRPKGAVHTHGSLQAQAESLCDAWEWRSGDRIPLLLPLHHVHGLVNVVFCALWSGARVDVPSRLDPLTTWERIGRGDLTLLMAVPTIYSRLIAAWEASDRDRRGALSEACGRMRLMVSGSAALPPPVLERWREISGHVLLERYGMTEIGMALSNPLHGERRAGHVGRPLPGVEVRLVDEAGVQVPPGTPGEIEVRGPTLFLEYWGRPEETRAAFRDDWFRTGDLSVMENGAFRILGRTSVDILKTGGYKVSALEIEGCLRAHPSVADCAVVGLPDPEWGDRVAAAVVPREGAELDPEELREWSRERLAPYKVPRSLHVVDNLPRNAMGKVLKPELRTLLEEGR